MLEDSVRSHGLTRRNCRARGMFVWGTTAGSTEEAFPEQDVVISHGRRRDILVTLIRENVENQSRPTFEEEVELLEMLVVMSLGLRSLTRLRLVSCPTDVFEDEDI